ncbi:exported hypothetical protein [uncultured Alphaproteobacteria bacterium]|uniref:Uncharacterized protein n=1 Tax=uncultured Alphaproteobacteria bacterium TaxID=91750 RepID=A0A212KCN6_9PROT|nr:exported hypothetical protein [uncultured Alphaproteobacteria bacterium]
MIKQLLAVTAIVGMMAGTALAQSSSGSGSGNSGSSGSQNLNHNPPTAGGVAPSGTDQTPMYRDSQGKPCTAGSAGCSRVEGTMKKK